MDSHRWALDRREFAGQPALVEFSTSKLVQLRHRDRRLSECAQYRIRWLEAAERGLTTPQHAVSVGWQRHTMDDVLGGKRRYSVLAGWIPTLVRMEHTGGPFTLQSERARGGRFPRYSLTSLDAALCFVRPSSGCRGLSSEWRRRVAVSRRATLTWRRDRCWRSPGGAATSMTNDPLRYPVWL